MKKENFLVHHLMKSVWFCITTTTDITSRYQWQPSAEKLSSWWDQRSKK